MVLDLRKTSFFIPNLVIRLILGMGASCILPCQIHLYPWLLADASEGGRRGGVGKNKPTQVTHQVVEIVILSDPEDQRIIYSLSMAY